MKAVMFFLTVAGSGWGIWWKIDGRVEKVEKSAGERIKATEDKAARVAEEMAAYKTHVAETFATKAGMQEQTGQIMRAIESVGNRIDGLTERLDRIYENQPRRTTRS